MKDTNSIQEKKPDIQVDIQNWLAKIASYWWVFIIGIAISVPLGQLYLRYATPLYEASAKMMIRKKSGGGISESGFAEQFGFNSGGENLNDKIQIITSRPIIAKAIEQINANITYFRQIISGFG